MHTEEPSGFDLFPDQRRGGGGGVEAGGGRGGCLKVGSVGLIGGLAPGDS